MKPQTITGTWEEICARESELIGHRLLVTVLTEEEPDALTEYIERMKNRTPEEIAATREQLFQATPPPRELPPGKTLADVIVGQWPGDETDEQVEAILRSIS